MRLFERKNIEQLHELKKGETGTGLLIERDGHIIGRKDTIQQIKEDIDNHYKFVIPDDFIVSAVFQKYGIKNANGRIYPEGILKKEVSRYLNEEVAQHRAIGALDHPSCQLADTRILTEKGWKYITDVEVGENILTVNEEKEIEIKPILKTINQPYKGKLIHLKGKFIDIKVTPNHKFPILDRNQKWNGFYTAQDILDNKIPDQSHCYLFKIGERKGENDKELSIITNKSIKEKYSQDIHVPMDNIGLHPKSLKVTEEDYDGRVYCVEVENHTFYTMCNNGKCLWSGNSSELSGHDVSHNIIDLRWEGHTLVGEMKLHLSPGFKRYGICSTSGDLVANLILDGVQIGVSSRAVGSVEEKLGALVVGDDLELIGWDVVMTPSTPGSYIKTNYQDLQPFIENRSNKNKNFVFEKIEKINKILK